MTGRSERARVVLVGGGVAALEAALALRRIAGDQLALSLVSHSADFVYRPLAVLRPFRSDPVLRLSLSDFATDVDAELVRGRVDTVAAASCCAVLTTGEEVAFDAALLAVGARATPVVAGAWTFWDWDDGALLRRALEAAAAGTVAGFRFLIPSGRTWPLPGYELALLTRAWLRRNNAGNVPVQLLTAETEPLQAFGAPVSGAIRRLFADRDISFLGRAPSSAYNVDASAATRERMRGEAVVALPVLSGPALAGVPSDAEGFIQTDAAGRVEGAEAVFSAGDCTASPHQQGGFAAQQARVAAAGIAAYLGVAERKPPPEPHLRALLLTGDGYLLLADDLPARLETLPPSDNALLWPPGKIVETALGDYLATRAGGFRPYEVREGRGEEELQLALHAFDEEHRPAWVWPPAAGQPREPEPPAD